MVAEREFLHAAEPEVKGSWSLPSQSATPGKPGLGERRVREEGGRAVRRAAELAPMWCLRD